MSDEPQPHWISKYYPFAYPDEYSDADREAALEGISPTTHTEDSLYEMLNDRLIHILSGITDSELKALEHAVKRTLWNPPRGFHVSKRLTVALTLRRLTSAVCLAGFIAGNIKAKP